MCLLLRLSILIELYGTFERNYCSPLFLFSVDRRLPTAVLCIAQLVLAIIGQPLLLLAVAATGGHFFWCSVTPTLPPHPKLCLSLNVFHEHVVSRSSQR